MSKTISAETNVTTVAGTDVLPLVQGGANYNVTMTQIRQAPVNVGIPNGTAAAPSLFINGDTDTGIYLNAANELGISAQGGLVLSNVGVANGVNYAQFTNAALGSNPTMNWLGADSVVYGYYRVKGAAAHIFETRTNVTQFRVVDTASAVNYATATGSATTSGVVFGAAGSDTDISVNITPKGNGVTKTSGGLQVNGSGTAVNTVGALHVVKSSTDIQVCLERTTTSADKAYLGGSANGLVVYSSSLSMIMRASQAGDISLCADQGAESLRAVRVASAVNRLEVRGSATTNAVSLTAAGSDSNIDVSVITKGTGLLNLSGGSSYTAGAWAATGYLSIKINGTTYKVGIST